MLVTIGQIISDLSHYTSLLEKFKDDPRALKHIADQIKNASSLIKEIK